MATIKKGTYRWNDELTDLGYTTEISIPFTVPPYVEIDDASVDAINSQITSANLDYPLLEYGIITSFVCNSIRFYKDDSYGYYIVDYGIESYTYSSDNPLLNLIFGDNREKINEVYHSGADGVVSGFNTGSLQYLTVLEDTVVDNEAFATWFNENTKPVVKKFTRLYSGDIVASSGGKCFKRLKTTIKKYALSVIAEGNVTIIDHTAPSTIKEGEIVTFDVKGNYASRSPQLIYTTTADVSHVANSSFVSSYDYSVTVSNATGDVTITLTDDIAPDSEQGG